MNAKVRIMFALALGLVTIVGTLLAMETTLESNLPQAPALDAPQTILEPYLIKDIYSGTASSSPDYFADVDGTLFFVATDGSPAKELWKSDGTLDGTVLVKEITKSFSIQYLTNVSSTIFFSARETSFGNELWKSDGTPTGTVLVKDINPSFWDSTPEELTNVNGTLFFSADDGTNGIELWKSDGTPTGTILVKDINPFGGSVPVWLTNMSGTLYFAADGGSLGFGLWKSDGTPTGTVMVTNTYAGYLTNVNGTLFFSGSDGDHGNELWKSDGTLTGTAMVKDIWEGTSSGWASGSYSGRRANVNGTFFFIANDGSHGVELWKSDGTPTGTVMVKDIWPGSSSCFQDPPSYSQTPPLLTNMDGTLYFAANDGSNGAELWKSDGTLTGTVMVTDINPGAAGSRPWVGLSLAPVNNTLFFNADDGTFGHELWKTDGTPAGTAMVKDIISGSGSSAPIKMKGIGNRLFFTADDGSHGRELWALLALQLNHRIYLPLVMKQ